jgi:hypothetical protein
MKRSSVFIKVLLVGVLALLGGSSLAASQVADAITLEQALQAPAEELAGVYLFSTYVLRLAEIVEAQPNVTLIVTDETIDQSNAAELIAALRQTLQTLEEAMRQRGSKNVAGAYDLKPSRPCRQFLIERGTAVIEQNGFDLHLAHGDFQGEFRDRGVIVESSIAFESAVNPDTYFVGTVSGDRIVLKHRPTRCTLTLVRR